MTQLLLDAMPNIPFAVVLEGGYDLPSLSACATAVLTQQLAELAKIVDKKTLPFTPNAWSSPPQRMHGHCQQVIEDIVQYHAKQGWPVSMDLVSSDRLEQRTASVDAHEETK